MDTYASQGSTVKEPVERVGDMERLLEKYQSSWIRISVEGFDHRRPEDEIKSELINHFKSCGKIIRVDVPADPIFESRAFVNLHGSPEVKEKALQLNGSDIGDWNALVKFAPEKEEEEYQVAVRYEASLYQKLANDESFFFGVAVWGYDTSLTEDEVKRILKDHFSSCGPITHVFVCTLNGSTNIYFSNEEGEASALDLNGSKVAGFKLTTMRAATVRSNPRLAPGDVRTVGYSFPAHFDEFAGEIKKQLEVYMTEWRVKARMKRAEDRSKQHELRERVKARMKRAEDRSKHELSESEGSSGESSEGWSPGGSPLAMIWMETGEGQSFEKM